MTGIVIRLVLGAVCAIVGARLLWQARVQRVHWVAVQAGVARAERWWAANHGRPFDQDGEQPPAEVAEYLGARGPRSDLKTPQPAQAHWVWGWILCAVAVALVLSVIAQVSTGMY